MKLQGTMVKKLSKRQKKQMQKTLDDMTNIRTKDTIRLRQAMQNELAFLKLEKEKIIKEEHSIRNKRLRMEGAIIVLTKLLSKEEE